VLFLPVLDIFTYMISCTRDSEGVLRHQEFTEIECFTGNHILNSVFSILLAFVFISISMIVGITFFECKSSSRDPSARVNARANFLYIWYEMGCILIFTFCLGDEYEYVKLFFILGGSLLLFVNFHFDSPYFNTSIGNMWSCYCALNL